MRPPHDSTAPSGPPARSTARTPGESGRRSVAERPATSGQPILRAGPEPVAARQKARRHTHPARCRSCSAGRRISRAPLEPSLRDSPERDRRDGGRVRARGEDAPRGAGRPTADQDPRRLRRRSRRPAVSHVFRNVLVAYPGRAPPGTPPGFWKRGSGPPAKVAAPPFRSGRSRWRSAPTSRRAPPGRVPPGSGAPSAARQPRRTIPSVFSLPFCHDQCSTRTRHSQDIRATGHRQFGNPILTFCHYPVRLDWGRS